MALLYQMEESQWLPPASIAKRQYEQLGLLATYADQHSPYFHERLKQTGMRPQDIASPEGFKRLPLLTRRDVQQAGPSLYCREIPPAHRPCAEAQTSGSTGQPVRVIRTSIASLFWQANSIREHFWHHRNFMKRALVIQSGDNQNYVRQQGWGKPVNLLFASGGILSLPITTDIRQQVREILEFKPEHLLIYPSNLSAIVTLCQKEGTRLPGIKHVWTRAEMLSPELRKKAADFLGASIEDNYSSEEMGIMALQCPESGLYHVMSENILLEVLDEDGNQCAQGQVGKVVVTDLHNFAMPLIRYVVGDYAEMGGACPCGRGLPTLKTIRGRERNLLTKPDGTRHWPRLAVEYFKDIDLINQYQFIQHSLEEIEVRLVTEIKLTEAQEASLITHLQENLGHPFRLRLTYFDGRLPLSARGKFEEFMSHVT